MKRFTGKKIRLGDLLIDQGVITGDQLLEAIGKQEQTNERLGAVLTGLGFASEAEIAKALQRQFGYEIVNLSAIKIGDDIRRLVTDGSILKKHVMIPFEYTQGNAGLNVAMADPMDLIAIDDLSNITNMIINPVISTTSDIMKAIDKYYGNDEVYAVAEAYSRDREQLQEVEEESEDQVNNAPIVTLMRTIIEQAVRQRASDIHIEPLESRIRVRYRIDGCLIKMSTYPTNMLQAMIARIKIVAGMDISEKRKPQDGRMVQIVDRKEYDIRVSTLPTVYGEKAVLKIASKANLMKEKSELGLTASDIKTLNEILEKPYGMLIVTGPTGSGKSTTLYTLLSELNNEDVNIVTVEDPVKTNIDGINQVKVNTKADITFVSALRAILRQDPDIIMIGEIRDAETANIATTASITGHLVVSTMHTNNAPSTIMRLIDMGIEPYLITDSTIGVVAQRLVKRLCSCKRGRAASNLEKKFIGVPENQQFVIYEPVGCRKCNETGFLGRIGVYEIMPITSDLAETIAKGGTVREIKKVAVQGGMHTLRMNAANLVRQGITTIEEMKKNIDFNL